MGKSGSKNVSYTVSGSQILSETSGGETIYYIYDDNGLPIGLKYKGNVYTYRKNLQGDIIGILDSTGAEVVYYRYNAWGALISIDGSAAGTVGQANPFRYRGYYYDSESGFYYLNSRYYDPTTGRFINADSYVSTGQGVLGTNMFAYCGNNPVNRVDFYGDMASAAGMLAYGVAAGGVNAWNPVGWIILGVTAVSAIAIGMGISATLNPPVAIPQDDVDEKVKVKDRYLPPDSPTVIYRHRGTNPANLTPSQRDVDLLPKTGKGLSFSFTPEPGCAETTIEEVNATGVLYARIDDVNHISVFPVGASLKQWHDAGTSSVWTQSLKSVVRKWGG